MQKMTDEERRVARAARFGPRSVGEEMDSTGKRKRDFDTPVNEDRVGAGQRLVEASQPPSAQIKYQHQPQPGRSVYYHAAGNNNNNYPPPQFQGNQGQFVRGQQHYGRR
eukprot:TRINITY_DN14018_c0_g1_i4.p4 TRINITY_DN14018_c0_g1~~TRINITY_DN14018_c0_g1_i4.p4  ORF type:complete len:109 (+),score=10.55 TRINITY_DN14018_c0_g1_i4:150-476(+)